MREILHIQVGQCGNNIGNAFWSTIGLDHRLDDDGQCSGAGSASDNDNDNESRLQKIHVYFQESESTQKKYVPRACFIDFDAAMLDKVKESRYASLFKPDNFLFGQNSTANNWAKAFYTDGLELVDEASDILRREVEACDCMQGFQLAQSIGGGTGAGFGSLLLLKIRDAYPDQIITTFSVYPSPKVSDVVVEPYNATLSIQQLTENSDATFVIDNEALFRISNDILQQAQPKYSDLNWIISMVMGGVTASLRFSGKLNGDVRKICHNLVPFPRLHFFCSSYAPLFAPGMADKTNCNVQELLARSWSDSYFLAEIQRADGKFFSSAQIWRGELASGEVDDEAAKLQRAMHDEFIAWIPNNVKTALVSVPDQTPISVTHVANTTAVKGVFERIAAQFSSMFKRKAFLHWYIEQGMEENELEDAYLNVRDLVTEYQDKQDTVVDANNVWQKSANKWTHKKKPSWEESQNDEEEESEEDQEEEDDEPWM